MPRSTLLALASALTLGAASGAEAQARAASSYRSHARLTEALDSIRRAKPQVAQLLTVGTSPGGRAIHALRLGAGADVDRRPALLVLANAYGPHLVGSEIALAAARRLASGYGSDTGTTRLLDRRTVYVIARANPDAAEAMFVAPIVERTRNGAPMDDDRDGASDEDGPDDLNGDGLITMMRVADPAGEWMTDPADPHLMRRADASKGEVGRWRVYSEGRDDDRDERWNEDGPGGTDVNKNFTYNYDWFGEGSGWHQFSSAESRAIAEFMVAHPNVSAAYVLGPQDNLVTPWTFRAATGIGGNPTGTSAGGPLQSILREDEGWYAELSRRYKRMTGITKSAPSAELRGDVLSWLYYDMGRLALGARGWSPPDAPADTARGATRPDTPDPLAEERGVYRWMRANLPDAVVPWRAITHPDFPGMTVEVGGLRPYAALNPTGAQLDSALAKQSRFVVELAGMLPSVALRGARVERVGDRVWRVTAQVANEGYLPTMAAIGSRSRWPHRVRVELKTSGQQQIVGGRKVQLLDAIRGSGRSSELTWVVVGDAGSTVTLAASSPVAGAASETITLRAR